MDIKHDQNIFILMTPLHIFIQTMGKHDQNIILMTPLHMFIQAMDIKHDQNIVILMTPLHIFIQTMHIKHYQNITNKFYPHLHTI